MEGGNVMLCLALLQLVNVQSNSEFASHMLNRDVWRDETVKNIIKVGFILYQASCACTCLARMSFIISCPQNG